MDFKDKALSPNFTLGEMFYSKTAERLGIDNTTDDKFIIESLAVLCVKVLEPVRRHFRKPVKVNSGYRAPALCKAIGSSPTSQHTFGEAADIEIEGVSNYDIAKFIGTELFFDKLILEFYNPDEIGSGWVHVSYREGANRNKVMHTNDGKVYLVGLPAPK